MSKIVEFSWILWNKSFIESFRQLTMKDETKKNLSLKSIKPKKRSWKFWVVFWFVAAFLLFSWYVFLQIKNKNIENLKPLINVAPVSKDRKNELNVLADVYQKMGGFDGEKTFLLLFQNNLELRPGGGFIGSFGVVKTQSGRIADIQVYDTGVFDGRVPNTQTPPAPLADILGIKSWKMRDSNWSPDFATNAKFAEYFYKLGDGQENFDGIIAINTDILNSILSITGPVKIDDYPGEYNDQTAILQLEYQVEKGFLEQGIQKGERKNIMKDLATILLGKIHNFRISQQMELAQKLEEHLQRKDIQFYFKDADLEKEIANIGWDGDIKNASGDYLMAIDANLNSLKSDYCIKRKIDYNVDLAGENPTAVLNITYQHTCRTKDWMTTDYRDWLRVYVPNGAYLSQANGQDGDVKFSDDLGKKVFGMLVNVPVGQSKTVTLKYNLPQSIKTNPYSLLLQKQSGSGETPLDISLKKADGSESEIKENLIGDKMFSF
jgi:hypothetical protein